MINALPSPRNSWRLFVATLVAVSSLPAGFAAKPTADEEKTTLSEPRAVQFPKSTFVYRDAAGKDPFFPDRQRLDDRESDAKVVEMAKPVTLPLRGITGSAERRVALIHDHPFTKDESGEIRIGTNTFRIRIIDIKEKSVLIQRDGQAGIEELPLIDNLLPINQEK